MIKRIGKQTKHVLVITESANKYLFFFPESESPVICVKIIIRLLSLSEDEHCQTVMLTVIPDIFIPFPI